MIFFKKIPNTKVLLIKKTGMYVQFYITDAISKLNFGRSQKIQIRLQLRYKYWKTKNTSLNTKTK